MLDGVSLEIGPGEVLGLVGESGSGKSSLAWAIMRALPGNALEVRGSIDAPRRIGIVFQDPATTLNPTLTIGRQLTEVLMRHQPLDRRAAWQAGAEALRRVELRDPAVLMRRYPHEASGGEKQRVGIAMAFACRPELHHLRRANHRARRHHRRARARAVPAPARRDRRRRALHLARPRPRLARGRARGGAASRAGPGRGAGPNHLHGPVAEYTRMLVAAVPRPDRRLVDDAPDPAPLLALEADRRDVRPAPACSADRTVSAARDISLDVHAGEILGVVGESGSGKSSVARAVTGLVPFAGTLQFGGRRIASPGAMDRDYRRVRADRVPAPGLLAQPPPSRARHPGPAAALVRPLAGRGIPELLEQVRLPPAFAARYPHQLSGGEKQRVAIARAFAARPRLVVCDEITAPLDVSVQASIIELLLELRRAHGTAYLFITHDLNLVRQIAHRLAVMQAGRSGRPARAAAISTPPPPTRAN